MSRTLRASDDITSPGGRRENALVQGRWLLTVAILTTVLTGPGQTIGVSVFIDPMVETLGLSRSAVASAYLVGTLLGSLAMPFVGRFVDRRGVRIAQVIIGVLFALALVNMSLVNGLVWLAVGFTGIRMLGQGSLSMVSTVTVQLSFVRSRGLAIGVFAMISSALMALVPILLNTSIGSWGWRVTWLVSALVVFALVVPLGWFGLRSVPRAGTASIPNEPDGSPGIDRSYTREAAVRQRGFWILASISSTTGMLSTALNFHQIDLLGAAGLSENQAAAMFLPQVFGSILAGLVVGAMVDRMGARYLPAASMVLLASVHLIGAYVAPGFTVLAYAFLLGAAGGAVRTISATLLPAWFGTSHIGSIQGILTFINVAGSAIGPLALAQLEAGFGDYRSALLVLFLLPVAVAVYSATGSTPVPVSVRPPD